MEFLKQSDEVLSVGEFSRRFKMLVKTCVPELWLRGEISNLKTYSSGHTYFTLKDEEGSISAVLFKGYSRAVSFQLREGMKVFLYGEIAVYEVRGCYQMVVKAALPDGTGDLARRFEELKKRLSAEGLFDSERKKPIPRLPGKIAVVTSPIGAAIRDFCKVLKRRGWRGKVYILPAKVQGIGSAAEIAERVKAAQDYVFGDGSGFDLLVVMRGGGSLEDLWSFNEEIVARAVAESRIPTISAVGHEIDFTLADFAADLRAETPSAAAEYISSSFLEFLADVENFAEAANRIVSYRMQSFKDTLESAQERLRLNSPRARVNTLAMRMDEISLRADTALSGRIFYLKAGVHSLEMRLEKVSPARRIELMRQHVENCAKRLDILGVENTLRRGFALVADSRGKVITSSSIAAGEDIIKVRFSDGEISASPNGKMG